jgi:hypothetical protein
VLERHLADRIAFVRVTHDADEARDRANRRIAFAHRGHFRAGVEIFGLYADGHKKATGDGDE